MPKGSVATLWSLRAKLHGESCVEPKGVRYSGVLTAATESAAETAQDAKSLHTLATVFWLP